MSCSTAQHPNSSSSSGPIVIGAGLMRTGTNSQMKAFEILLGGRCYHMEYILHENRSHLKLWYQAATRGLTKELADEIFHGFRSCADFPASNFYGELAQIYPNAKFVLSVREPTRWAVSMRATILGLSKAVRHVLTPVIHLVGLYYIIKLRELLVETRMGIGMDATDEEMIRAFDRHTEAVIRTIPKDRLLVFRVTDGWEPLCKFLDLPVPDVPFPNVNDTKEFQRTTRNIFISCTVLNAAFCAAVGSVVWFGAKYCLQRWG